MSSQLNSRSFLASAASFGDRVSRTARIRPDLAKLAGIAAFAALVAGALVALPQASVEQASAAVANPEISAMVPQVASIPAACATRSWPYVDQSCLSNAETGNVRTVRLVNTDGIAAKTITTLRPTNVAVASVATTANTHVAANSGAVMSGILRSDFVAPAKAAPAKTVPVAAVPAPQLQAAAQAAKPAPRKVQVAANRNANIHYGRDVMAARTVSVRQDDLPGLAYAAAPLDLRPF